MKVRVRRSRSGVVVAYRRVAVLAAVPARRGVDR